MRHLILEIEESLRIAFMQVRIHKTRAALTALGVIIGIVAVTLMGTAINSIDKGIDKSLDMLGSENFYVEQWPWKDVGDDWWKYRGRPEFKVKDAELFNEILEEQTNSSISMAVPQVKFWIDISYKSRQLTSIESYGTTSEYAFASNNEIEKGRFFTKQEDLSGNNVVVLGYDVAENLFPNEDAIGKTVRFNQRANYRVIGVFKRQGSFLGMFSMDSLMVMPHKAMRKIYNGNRWNSILVKMKTEANKDAAQDETVGIMRRVRGLMPEEENDFEVNRSESVGEQLDTMKNSVALAGLFITGLSLFVGAIGIMNITFVSVKERTREIGTRRALGATRRSILIQFLTEAVFICMIGGVVGLGLTTVIVFFVKGAMPFLPIAMKESLFLIAAAVSIATGILSGFAPAWTASKLDPAEALRHD
jgi:putative ABC transport system permease protein